MWFYLLLLILHLWSCGWIAGDKGHIHLKQVFQIFKKFKKRMYGYTVRSPEVTSAIMSFIKDHTSFCRKKWHKVFFGSFVNCIIIPTRSGSGVKVSKYWKKKFQDAYN